MRENIEQRPFTPEEKEQLQTIHDTRSSIFTTVTVILALMVFLASFKINYRGVGNKTHIWNKHDDGDGAISPFIMILVNNLFLDIPLFLSMFWVYKKSIGPFSSDVKNGVKEMVPYQVIRKTYFPITDQYFISFDDPDYMHHEVDAMFYNSVNDGDTVYLSRAPKSKYVFEMNGRFTLM